MKIGFVHVTNTYDVHWWPSLAFGSLKAYLHKHLGDSVVMDRVNPTWLHKYDIAAISSTTQDYNQAKALAQKVKQENPKAIVVVGGSHITWLPDTLSTYMDFGVIGEGEQTLLELVQFIMSNGNLHDLTELVKIKGLAINWGRGNILSGSRTLIEPLDNIPHPFREPASQPHLFTSRGCPYKCRFCSSSAFWKKTRLHSADYVVEEIESLVAMGAYEIPIQDDLFVVDKKRFFDIIEKLKQRGLDKKFITSIAVRANLVNDELCQTIKGFAPIKSVHFGAESASDRILQLMGKGVKAETNQAALDKLHSYGIPCGCAFVVGWPSETEEELRMTLEFIRRNGAQGKLDPNSPVNILTPFPGTAIWDEAVMYGFIDVNTFNWDRLGIFAAYQTSNAPNFDSWVDLRRSNNSVYLNEVALPQERLYQVLKEHNEIVSGKR